MPDVIIPDIWAILSDAGVRPTRQRITIGIFLWARPGTQHVETAMLHADIAASCACISLATVYNTLPEFERYFGLGAAITALRTDGRNADKAGNRRSWVNVCFDVDRGFLKRKCMIVALRPRRQRKTMHRYSASVRQTIPQLRIPLNRTNPITSW